MAMSAAEMAKDFVDSCKRLGWTYTIGGGSIVTIEKRFVPGDNNAFVECDMEYFDILNRIPRTSAGSIWGTDGGGIGAISALKHGVFRESKSGCSKRVIAQLKKL